MRLTTNLSLVFALFLLTLPIIIVNGCGNNNAVPDTATIEVSPASVSMTNIAGDTPQNITVTVRYADGTPIPYANIHIAGAFAEPATAANYQFYWYPDGTQNPLGNAAVDSGFRAQTDKYGVFEFSIVVFGSSGAFSDTIYVTSGTASGQATLSLSRS